MATTHGGKRANAGRPKGKGKYGEPTVAMRVPSSKIIAIKKFIETGGNTIPLYTCSVQAGFPSPADDHIEQNLDLNDYLIPNPTTSFLVRAEGDSMLDASINPGDLLVIDRSITPKHNKIVIAAIEGELTVKRLYINEKEVWLVPENSDYASINITGQDTVIWGVVTNVIHTVR